MSHDEETRRAADALRAIACEHGAAFESILVEWVRDASSRGLIGVEHEAPFAVYPQTHRGADIPASEWSRRLAADNREAAALTAILPLGSCQVAALAALKVPLTDTPTVTQVVAADLRSDVALLASGKATSAALARVSTIIDAEVKRRGKADAWMLLLADAFMMGPVKNDRAAVGHVLDVLSNAPDAPRQFRTQKPEHLARAEAMFRRLRKDGPCPYTYRIKWEGKVAKGWVTSWGAAQRFAEAFGLDGFIAKRSSKTRDRKAERAR